MRKREHWFICPDPTGYGTDWPIPLSYGKRHVSPIWVWGDRKLARQACQVFNQLKIKPSHD